jgi:predicted MFS family arabinose efflux permease
MFAVGGTCSLLMAPCGPALAGHVEGKAGAAHGSVFSLLNITFSLGIMAGPVLGSVLTDILGLELGLAALACGFALYLLPLAGHGRGRAG